MKSTTETAPYLAMVARLIRRGGERVGSPSADVEDLTTLVGLHGCLDDAIAAAVVGLREQGFTWQRIGAAVGITRQGAIMRWGKSS